MKTFIVLAASAIALASGLCLEDDEVVAMCTVGTDIGKDTLFGTNLPMLAFSLTHKSLKVRSLRQLQLHVRMALQQEEGGERVKERARDRRSAPLLRRSGRRFRRRWEVKRYLIFGSLKNFIMVQMSCVSSSRLAGWMRAMSLTMPLLWLTLLAFPRRYILPTKSVDCR